MLQQSLLVAPTGRKASMVLKSSDRWDSDAFRFTFDCRPNDPFQLDQPHQLAESSVSRRPPGQH